MPAMLRGASASTQARNVLRSNAPRAGLAVLQSMALTPSQQQTDVRNRNERRDYLAALRRGVHELPDPGAALRREYQERPPLGPPSKPMVTHLARPIPTPSRMVSYAHHFLGSRNEHSASSRPDVDSLAAADKRATFVLRMHGVEEIDRNLAIMRQARGIDGIFEQGAAGLIEYFSKSLPSFRHFYKVYRYLPEDLNRLLCIHWDLENLKSLHVFLYDQMGETTSQPAKFIHIVEQLEHLAIEARLLVPLPLPSYHDADFREQWKYQHATYVAGKEDVHMPDTPHEHQYATPAKTSSQNTAFSSSTSSDLDTQMSDAPALPSLGPDPSSLPSAKAPLTMPTNSATTQPTPQRTGLPTPTPRFPLMGNNLARPSAPAPMIASATHGASFGTPIKPTGLLTSVHAANMSPSTPGPAAATSSKAAAKSLFSAPFATADHLVRALDNQLCIAEVQAEMVKLGTVVSKVGTLRIAHFPIVKASVDAVSKAKGNGYSMATVAEATSWQVEMHNLRSSLQSFPRRKMQTDTRTFFDTLCSVLDWFNGISTPAAHLSATIGSSTQGLFGSSFSATSNQAAAIGFIPAPAASSFTSIVGGKQGVFGAGSNVAPTSIASPFASKDSNRQDGFGRGTQANLGPAAGPSSSPAASSGDPQPLFANNMPDTITSAAFLGGASVSSGASPSRPPRPSSLQLFPADVTTQTGMALLNGNFSLRSFHRQLDAEFDALKALSNAGAVVDEAQMPLLVVSTAAVEYALSQAWCVHNDIWNTHWYSAIGRLSRFWMNGGQDVKHSLSRSPDLQSMKTNLGRIIVAIDNVVNPDFAMPVYAPQPPPAGSGDGGSSGRQGGLGGSTGSSSGSAGNPCPSAVRASANGSGGNLGQAIFAGSLSLSFNSSAQPTPGGASHPSGTPASQPSPPRPLPSSHHLFDDRYESMKELSTALRNPLFRKQLAAEDSRLKKLTKKRDLIQESDVPLFRASIRAVHNSYEMGWFDATVLKSTSGIWLALVEALWNFGNYCDTSAHEADFWSKADCLKGLWGQADDINDCMAEAGVGLINAFASSTPPPVSNNTGAGSTGSAHSASPTGTSATPSPSTPSPTTSGTSNTSTSTTLRPGLNSAATEARFRDIRAYRSLPTTSDPSAQDPFTLANKGKQRAGTPAPTTTTDSFSALGLGLNTGDAVKGGNDDDDDYESHGDNDYESDDAPRKRSKVQHE